MFVGHVIQMVTRFLHVLLGYVDKYFLCNIRDVKLANYTKDADVDIFIFSIIKFFLLRPMKNNYTALFSV